MNEFSEDKLIEQTAIKIFGELWGAENFANAYSGEMDAEFGRENPGEVVLMSYLKIALVKLNPNVSTEALNLAIDEIIKDRSAMSMVNANHEIWQLLKDGVKVETDLPAEASAQAGNENGERAPPPPTPPAGGREQ